MPVRSFKIIKSGSIPFDAFEPVDSRAMALKNLSGIGCGSTVTYIESDARILVDTGFDFENTLTDDNVKANKKRLTHALKAHGLKPSDIDILFITHWHLDHFGNVKMFKDSTIMTSEAAVSRVKIDVTGVKDGEQIADGVKVVHTPGHTADHASVVFKTDRLRQSIQTSAGGRIVGIGEVTVAAAGDAILTPAFYATDSIWTQNKDFSSQDAAAASIGKLVDQADYIIPGHGDLFRNVKKPQA
ncbi:MBL fold metallo-hydrolase [Methanocella sp. MCL-LM]|uniref:MBL fold metallo-hydrolase n=1 Tax=Methanocella sp. MCL-LM TaxID=3412035 RepID=UPI003C735281